MKSASPATAHSPNIASSGSAKASGILIAGNSSSASSRSAETQSTQGFSGYRPRSRSRTSAYSAKIGGLTRAVKDPWAHASRHCEGWPRQKQALTTTLVSRTARFTVEPSGGSGEPRESPRRPPARPRRSWQATDSPQPEALARERRSRAGVCGARSIRRNSRYPPGRLASGTPVLGAPSE